MLDINWVSSGADDPVSFTLTVVEDGHKKTRHISVTGFRSDCQQ
jgi:hypothetical protein